MSTKHNKPKNHCQSPKGSLGLTVNAVAGCNDWSISRGVRIVEL